MNNDNVAIVTHNANSDLNKVKKYSVNSSSMEEIENLINTFKPSIIINSAGITDIEKCENNYQLAYEANVNLPKKFQKLVKIMELNLFIYLRITCLTERKEIIQKKMPFSP